LSMAAVSGGPSCGYLLSALCAVGLEGHWAGGVHSVACCVVLTLPSSGPALGAAWQGTAAGYGSSLKLHTEW
jgi:hypothetical protein